MNNFLTLSLIIQINLARITNNDPECEVFKNKIREANVDELNSTPLQVGGVVSFEPQTANLVIQLHYNDDQYFFDPRFKGLTKEDGIDNELTCLDLKLLKFPDSQFNESTQQEITDLTPVASSNETTKWRYLSYLIRGDQLKTRLIESESTTNFVYTGYYAIAYYIQAQVQFTYQFQFSVTVNKSTSATIDTSFFYFSYIDILQCKVGASCTANPSSSVEFCTNSTCAETTKIQKIYINQDFWLIQKITTTGLTQNYLSDTEIRFVGEGLSKPTKIESENYTVPGQAIYKIKATFAWTKLLIKVNSVMKTTLPTRRLLADNEITQKIFGESVETCILVGNSTECPTCDEMIANNPDGDAPKECDSSAKMFLFIGLALLGFIF